ncbi:MAG: hypothetical protein R2932_42700 [Caldilineaceae bacterium]
MAFLRQKGDGSFMLRYAIGRGKGVAVPTISDLVIALGKRTG